MLCIGVSMYSCFPCVVQGTFRTKFQKMHQLAMAVQFNKSLLAAYTRLRVAADKYAVSYSPSLSTVLPSFSLNLHSIFLHHVPFASMLPSGGTVEDVAAGLLRSWRR